MAEISDVNLELPLLGGNQYRVVVTYNITFAPEKVTADPRARYRHVVKLFGDGTNTGDGFDDGQDNNIRTLVDEVITARNTPLTVTLNKGPFGTAELNEDPEFVLGPFRDEIRARVTLTPVSGPWAQRTRQSNRIQQAFEPA
jgi:hypothetical protein